MSRRPINPDDYARFVALGDPQISPDAGRVAFVVQKADLEKDRAHTDIFVVSSSGGAVRQLTSSGKDSSPRWSSDSRKLAFVSDRSGKPQVWIIDTTGGEAWCLQTEQAVGSPPAWSPDGSRIAFTSAVFSQGPEWTPYPGAPEGDRKRAEEQASQDPARKQDEDSKIPDVRVITRYRHKFDGQGYFGDKRNQVFIVDVPAERPATPVKARQVTSGDHDYTSPSWSPDGRRIILTATRSEDADWLDKADIWSVDIASGEMTLMLDAMGISMGPVFSADGTLVAYGGHDCRHHSTTSPEARVFSATLGRPASEHDVNPLTRALDRPLGGFAMSDIRHMRMGQPVQWGANGTLYFIVGSEGDSFVYRWTSSGGLERMAGADDHTISALSVAGETMAYVMGSHTEPDQLYCSGPSGTIRLTDLNREIVQEIAISEPRRLDFKGPDGWDIDGWVLAPDGFEPGKKHPAVLLIHGGPSGVYGSAFNFQEQMFASHGIAVIYLNPRGSSSYGQAFTNAVVEDWGGNDYQDLMAGVDEVIRLGIADPDRLGVTGWSYGGYMTCWVVTKTQRFKAASTGACISNRMTLYGMGDIVATAEHYFGSTPWGDPDKILERSAIIHMKNVTTPVLILHGESDLRCPVGQGEEFFTALKRQKKPAVFVRYPGEYHGFRKPSHIVDRYRRLLAWFEYHLKR
ncbi:MAG: S9 family peptidase [Bacillota bacterium]|nr:S9 family peptidase [Bacillota bacterium]